MDELRACANCSLSFIKRKHNQRFCSERCRYQAKGNGSRGKPQVVCRQCGALFPDARGSTSRLFCCNPCRVAWVAENPTHGPSRPVPPKPAPTPFIGPHIPCCVDCLGPAAGRRRCGQCRFKAWRATPEGRAKHRENKRNAKLRRRARKASGAAEVFWRSEIFERDGWVCGICAKKIDRSLRWPDPMSVSLDHILPLAHGGEHTRANTQAAHLICNSLKSDGVAGAWEQLRMVG